MRYKRQVRSACSIPSNHSSFLHIKAPALDQILQSSYQRFVYIITIANRSIMSLSPQVILILGSGPRTGDKIASAFSAKGYKVAVTSRKAKENYNSADKLSIVSDLADPSSVAHVFSEVKEKWGNPNVVIYNGEHHVQTRRRTDN